MSFSSIFKKIEMVALKVIGVADSVVTVATPLLGPVLGPSAAAILVLIQKGVNGAESLITGVDQGLAKKQTAGTIVTAELTQLSEIVAEFGANLKLSPAAEQAIGVATDGAVAVANAIQTILAELKAVQTVPVVTPVVTVAKVK
jgi:hypothetical protein